MTPRARPIHKVFRLVDLPEIVEAAELPAVYLIEFIPHPSGEPVIEPHEHLGRLLSDLFADHIAGEETNVFPTAKKFISEKEAMEIGQA